MGAISIRKEELSPVEQFVMDVLPPDRLDSISRDLPAHIKPAMFQRNLLNAVMENPELMNHPPGLVFREVSKAAALGLFLDKQLGEAYIIECYNYKSKKVEPQLRVGYQGLIKLARQSGEVAHVYAHEVHANDLIEASLGADKQLIHKPKLFTDRGSIIGYYAVVKFSNGDFDFEPMDMAQIHAIRDRADGWKAFVEKKIKTTPWASDESEMAKKTVIRRLTKRMPKSPELASAIKIEDAAEHSAMIAGPRVVVEPPIPPEPPMIEASATTHPVSTVEPPIPPLPPEPETDDAPAFPLAEKLREACMESVERGDAAGIDDAWARIVAPHEPSLSKEQYEMLASIAKGAARMLAP